MKECVLIEKNPPIIVCAAIKVKFDRKIPHQPYNVEDNEVVFTGLRHCNCFIFIGLAGLNKDNGIQGFVTSDKRFVTREEAAVIAFEAKQISGPTEKLFSEDLY